MLERSKSYTIEKTRINLISSIFKDLILLTFLFSPLFDIYNSWILSLGLSFKGKGLAFFLIIVYIETILMIPFQIYNQFRIENRYGFNTMTFGLWLSDLIKSLIISTIIMGFLIYTGLWIVEQSTELWWLWIWVLFFVTSIFILYISPYVIEPLFNKFEPVEKEGLKDGIRELCKRAGIHAGRILKMDASKRTRHTNAYFTGIGRVKRVVLFDTLCDNMDDNEILSVLAHEIGHWKKRHLLKMLIMIEALSMVLIYLSFRMAQGDTLTRIFHIAQDSFYAKIVALYFIWGIVLFPFIPLHSYLSRKYEKEADLFAYRLTGDAMGMVSALVKLAKENLSNLYPHPLYVRFFYSHPPVLDRIRLLKQQDGL